ncbi:MAG: hypothetical protein LBK59_07115 [Bifidobacteriaceae bacterium]|nr:hypothetical protein [Bifidobacteriaceae bacterium]
MDPTRAAWLDESIHVSAAVPMYVLAAVIADPDACQPIRDALRRLARNPRRRIHWRDEEAADRMKAVNVIAAANVDQIVVVGTPLDPRKQERARRKCMERITYHFTAETVLETVWVESRTESLNQADRAMFAALRGSRVLGGTLRYEFALPSLDPMLWAADVAAGAVAASYRDEPAYREVLTPRLRVYDLSI